MALINFPARPALVCDCREVLTESIEPLRGYLQLAAALNPELALISSWTFRVGLKLVISFMGELFRDLVCRR